MKKLIKSILIAVGILIVISAVVTVIAYGNDSSLLRQWGEQYRTNQGNRDGSDIVIVSYKDFVVTKKDIEDQKSMAALLGEKIGGSDIEIANDILIGQLLLEEAERLGLAATKEEVELYLDSVKNAIEINSEGVEQLYEYCKGAGITIDEYLDMLRKQLPSTMSRQKLKNDFKENYYKENGLDLDKITPEDSANANAAFDAYRDSLLERYKDEIKYR